MLKIVISLALLCEVVTVSALSLQDRQKLDWRSMEDRIQSLPGLREMPDFSMYSGYLEISATKSIHYWLNECTDPDSNKLIIWFNGGPGCSSLDGLFVEHGPFMFRPVDGTLERNPYSWNRLAHTLYIESPAGVGFSYDTEEDSDINDDIAAMDNLAAIKKFFMKFPSYHDYELYISGESYAGVYVPTLVNAIIDDGSWMVQNIKGIMIGNGLLNFEFNSQSVVYFAYYHGLFGTTMWEDLHRYCCPSTCNFYSFHDEDCMLTVSRANHIIANDGLNLYNLYGSCYTESENLRFKHQQKINVKSYGGPVTTMNRPSNGESLTLVPTCTNASYITNYLNKPAVQEAIHVREKEWEICNEHVLSRYEKQYGDVTSLMQRILESLDDVRVLLYFGDVDMACNFMGGQWFVNQLGYEVMTPRRKWIVETSDGSMQVAGFYKEYDRLAFVTIKGAGHMTPTDKPMETFTMLERFMNEEPL